MLTSKISVFIITQLHYNIKFFKINILYFLFKMEEPEVSIIIHHTKFTINNINNNTPVSDPSYSALLF